MIFLLQHRLKKHREDTRRHVEEDGAHLAGTTVGQLWARAAAHGPTRQPPSSGMFLLPT
jgi:hypothetical protein